MYSCYSHDSGHYILLNPVNTFQSTLGIVSEGRSATFDNGSMVCRFSREKTVDPEKAESEKVYDLKQSYYFIMAQGKADDKGRNKDAILVLSIV